MDPLSRLTAHHASTVGIVVELAAVALVAALLALVWWRGRRRGVDRRRRIAEMRDGDGPET
ncbi:MAG TPA: hypothetical protein VH572_08550 [Gaiella sp.]